MSALLVLLTAHYVCTVVRLAYEKSTLFFHILGE